MPTVSQRELRLGAAHGVTAYLRRVCVESPVLPTLDSEVAGARQDGLVCPRKDEHREPSPLLHKFSSHQTSNLSRAPALYLPEVFFALAIPSAFVDLRCLFMLCPAWLSIMETQRS